MSNKHHARILLGAIASLGLSATPVFAATYTIAPTGSSLDWNTVATWDQPSGTPGSAAADTAIVSGNFGASAAKTVDISATPSFPLSVLTIGNTNATPGATTISASNSSSLGFSTGTINSLGGLSAVNTISAPISITTSLTLPSTNTSGMSLTGNVSLTNNSSIVNQMTGGAALTIGSGVGSQIQNGTFTLTFNNTNNSNPGTANSTILDAVITGTGAITFGGNQNPLAVYTIKQSQTTAAAVTINRQTYVLAADNPFGTGTLTTSNNNSANIGGELQSNNDARILGNAQVRLGNAIAFTGSNSLTIPNALLQTNNRVLGNNVASGKALFLTGLVGMDGAAPTTNFNNTRVLTIDGTGKTVIDGKLVNALDFVGSTAVVGTNDTTAQGFLIKRGSGRLELNNATNTIRGTITSNGGLVVFGVAGSYGAASSIVANAAGGVSYAPGTGDSGFATFASKLGAGTGFLALKPSLDSAANLDFTTTFAAASNLSVAGDGDMTYTGTVTPNATAYNWGGTSGKLTLGNNAGTGARNVNYTNGGTVVMTGTPDYTGATSVNGVVLVSTQNQIAAKANVNSSTGTQNINLPSTLEVASVSNAGAASSLGASSNAASNLVLNMGTLRHTGAADSSTDRLFTIGYGGATLESTGAGAVTFGSAGGLNVTLTGTGSPIPVAVPRTLTLGGTNTGANTVSSNLANGGLAGDILSVTKTGTGTWVLGGTNSYTGATTVSAGTLLVNGSITGAGAVSVAAGATLGGSGLITGTTTVTGTLAPGNSAGLLNFGGNLTLAGASTSKFEINGTSLGVSYDSISAVGAITYGGTLNLVFGAAVAPGTYDLINAASQSGDFSAVSFTGAFADSMIGSAVITPGTGWSWASAVNTYVFDNASGNLIVTSAVPEPSSVALLAGMAVLGGCLTRRRRAQS